MTEHCAGCRGYTEPAYLVREACPGVTSQMTDAARAPLGVSRDRPCPDDPKCYRYQGHDGEHLHAEGRQR